MKIPTTEVSVMPALRAKPGGCFRQESPLCSCYALDKLLQKPLQFAAANYQILLVVLAHPGGADVSA